MRTGAAGAIAAAGAAAYMNRENIGRSLSYMNKENVGKGLSHINRDEVGKGLSALNLESIRQALSSVNRENIEQGLAYMSRENIGHGFAWVSSHLQFVSALVKGNELQSRIERVSALEGVGFADLYTSLGPNDVWSGGYFIAERTFCAVPNPEMKANKFFIKEINTKAKDEPDAHLSMFMPARNTGYDEMAGHAKGLIMNWAMNNGKGVVDRYRLNKAREGFSRVTRYTYGEKSGLTEVEKAKQSAKEAKGWGIWPRRKADDKAGQPESKPTRYVVDGKSGLIEISTDGKRIPVEQDPVQKAVDEVAPEPEATPDDGEAQSNAEGEETGGASELDLENVPGVTEDLDLEGTSDGSGFPKEASQEETVAPAG
ncbi:MAG: hypothetical protein M1833_004943 [Piccolia ochrophora]|nr:MAG: hypothetical protein M1833_004943 [Piccolia ochrophora]